jgi:hypothetical protein
MKTHSQPLLLVVALLLGMQTALGQTPAELFNRGNDDYRAGKYADAVKEYQEIIDQGMVSAEVYFNIGNAYYRQGKIAQAILAYERAKRLKPGDADIAHNLRLVNFKTVDRIEPVPDLFLIQWMRSVDALVPFQTALQVLMAGWIVFFIALAGVYVIRQSALVRYLRWTVLIALLAMVLAGSAIGNHSMLALGDDQGIITASVVTAKSSPDDQSMNAFVVHEGLKVKMGDTLGDWVKITLADGKVGWVHDQQCERI